MNISITDPLALVAIQAGQVTPPTAESAAAGGSQLDVLQRAVQIGEPVPIVFGRRRTIDGIACGGVLISPGATEARFENNSSNAVTAYYHLVLSEGQIDSIPVKDVFQRSCRVGSHSQTYSRRAGTWTPGNTITQRPGYDLPEASYYCGSIGAYPGMSTLSFSVTIPDGFDQWKRQVHAFIRGGMHVPRLYDAITGASDNFADLVQWMLTNSGRVPTSLIDTVGLSSVATFLEANGFTCNCWITESRNYADLLVRWAPYFLLRESNASGKRGLRPLLPTNSNGTLKTTAITPVYTFDANYITPSSVEIQYSSLADRRPFVAQMIWRQQLEDDFGIIRTAEVRYAGTADTGPYESHDLSEFCTREAHAVKVGAYILSKRVRTSHTLRFTARPQAHNTLVGAGDIIRVRLERQATTAGTGYHDFLYQVERITKTLAGDLSYECSHFPVDDQGRSLIALDVAAATGTGILLTSNKSGVGCDINSSTNNTIPAETWQAPDLLGGGNGTGGGGGGGSLLSLGIEAPPSTALDLTSQQRTGTLEFISADAVATSNPNVYEVTITARTVPPPLYTGDGLDDNATSLPSEMLIIDLSNSQNLLIPPPVPPATASQGQVIFQDDVTGQSLPVTRIISASTWVGGGFTALDITDTIQYTIGTPAVPSEYRMQAVNNNGVAELSAANLTYDYPPPTLSLTGGPFNDPIMDYSTALNRGTIFTGNGFDVGTGDFTLAFWVQQVATTTITDKITLYGNVGAGFTFDVIRNIGTGLQFDDANGFQALWFVSGPPLSWQHYAICRSGSSLYFFANGASIAPYFSQNPNYADPISAADLRVNSFGGLSTVKCRFNQIYFTRQALYTSNFTPPTQRY